MTSSLERRIEFAEGTEGRPSLDEWVITTPVILDGRPFTFEKHEYLIEPYRDAHPYQVEIKAAQLGLSTKAMLRALYACRFMKFRGVLYLFPSKSDVLDFSKARITPLIEDNPDSLGKWIADTDAAGIKRIYDGFLYLRGMISRVGLKSVPADLVIFDELDEAPQNAVGMAMERMGHSQHKEVLMLSNPTLPDYGIDREFQQTDQRHWLVKCEKCGQYTCLEDSFPDCLLELEDKVIRGCFRCHAELDPSVGQWVAKRPQITDRRGYRYSQLFSHFVDPAEILHQYRHARNRANFYNLKLGMAFVDAENRLAVQEVLNLCSDHGIASSDLGPCTMGVDQGTDIHVVIGKRDGASSDRIVNIGVHKEWEELDALMDRFNVTRCVVDALPETRNARTFAERHRGRVFLNYYIHTLKGPARWDEQKLTVQCNRTESMDASHHEIQNRKIAIPRQSPVVEDFAEHLHNVAKKLEENEETGSKHYVYVRLGPDHFRHAFNYECLARNFGAESVFSGLGLW
jgi:hypothetical protein